MSWRRARHGVSWMFALAAAAALTGCVDKTPPPLWPTPPPPPMATPIGDPGGSAATPAGGSDVAEPRTPDVPSEAAPGASPDQLGPWQPGRHHR